MDEKSRPFERVDADSLLAVARAGGPKAGLAAKRAALLAERDDPALAREALTLLVRLEPFDPTPKLALARMHAEAGAFDEARREAGDVFAEAVDQAARARAAFMLGEIARVHGEAAEARGRYETTLTLEEAILAANRFDPTAARWYARARGRLAELDANAGEHARAKSGAEGALAMLRAAAAQIGETPVLAADIADAEMRLGALELDDNQPASARRRLGEAIGRYEALAVTEKTEPHWRAVLADAWALAAEAEYVRGAPDHAREAMDKALQARIRLAAKHPEEAWALAGTWRLRAALRSALGDADVAAQSMFQARTLAQHLMVRSGGLEQAARFLVHTLLDQADQALAAGNLNLAREATDAARMNAEALAMDPAAAPRWCGDVAACWNRLGEIARLGNAQPQALDAFSRATEFRRMQRDNAPTDARAKRGLAAALVRHGEAALAVDASETARVMFNESVGLRLEMLEAKPEDANAAHALAVALERLGLAALACGDAQGARRAWEDELALADRIFQRDEIEGLRFCAIVEAHLAGAGGPFAEEHRQSSLARFDALARAGAMSEREAALRKRLWNGREP